MCSSCSSSYTSSCSPCSSSCCRVVHCDCIEILGLYCKWQYNGRHELPNWGEKISCQMWRVIRCCYFAHRNTFVEYIEIRLCWPFSNWFWCSITWNLMEPTVIIAVNSSKFTANFFAVNFFLSKQNSAWLKINQKTEDTICFWLIYLPCESKLIYSGYKCEGSHYRPGIDNTTRLFNAKNSTFLFNARNVNSFRIIACIFT